MGPNKHNIHRIRYGILRSDPTGLSHIYNLTDISNAHMHRPIREKDNNFGNKLQVKRHGTDQAFKWWPVTLKIRSGMLFPNLTLKKRQNSAHLQLWLKKVASWSLRNKPRSLQQRTQNIISRRFFTTSSSQRWQYWIRKKKIKHLNNY